MKRTETRFLTIAMGILVVLGIVLSQVLHLSLEAPQKKQAKTEQHQEENSDGQMHVSVPSSSLPSSTHLELNPNVFLLFEILFEEEVFEVPELNFFTLSSQIFRTIFGVTISPNAP